MKTAAAALTLLLHAACVDISPIAFVPPDAAVSLDGSTAGDAATADAGPSACALCLQAPAMPGPGCQTDWNACQADEKCGKTVVCAEARGCFARANQPDVINCGSECAVTAGIAAATDPSVTLVFPIIGCALGPCATACKEGHAP